MPAAHHLRTPGVLLRQGRTTREGLLDFQSRQLRRLVRHAHGRVPYYRRLFEQNGLHPDDIRGTGDLSAIPVTSKGDLRNLPLGDILSGGARPGRLVKRMSSGSSGMPFTIWRSFFEDHLIHLFRVRACTGYGMRASDRLVVIAETPSFRDDRRLMSRCKKILGLFRTAHIDCYREEGLILAELARIRPDIVAGYPSTLAALAAGANPGRIRPRLALTGGGVMTAAMRRRIEEGFACPVFDVYGAHEFNILAWECPLHGAYHVCEGNVILEILKDGRPAAPGEAGEVIATGLHTLAMPFIRYRTGDVATRGGAGCACGAPFATIGEIQGRTIDYFHLAGGRKVHPYLITAELVREECAWICQHQLVRESGNRVVLRIRPFRPPRGEEIERLRRAGQEKVGPGARFSVELVQAFACEPGKKFPPYVCLPDVNPAL